VHEENKELIIGIGWSPPHLPKKQQIRQKLHKSLGWRKDRLLPVTNYVHFVLANELIIFRSRWTVWGSTWHLSVAAGSWNLLAILGTYSSCNSMQFLSRVVCPHWDHGLINASTFLAITKLLSPSPFFLNCLQGFTSWCQKLWLSWCHIQMLWFIYKSLSWCSKPAWCRDVQCQPSAASESKLVIESFRDRFIVYG
jgi:hypothetical protein